MSQLARLALETLEDPSSPPDLKAVAAFALLRALEQAVEVPLGTHMAVWRYLLSYDSGAAVLQRHEIPHPDVARDAIRVLLDPDSGETAQDLALAVLRGANVAEVDDLALFAIADRVLDESRARRITWLIQQVHEERGLSPDVIVALRERLVVSPLPIVRASAVEIGALLVRLDEGFAAKMLGDESPIVRAAVADELEKVDQLDRERATALVRGHLVVETHRTVVSACHYALGSLIRSSGRRVRQWEPPTGSEN